MDQKIRGWCHGLVGVIIFAGSLPATKIAIIDFSAEFLTVARASLAGLIAGVLLFFTHQPLPTPRQWYSIVYVCLGVVIGFPLFTALALQYIESASSIVFVGILPLMTAFFAVLLADEKPTAMFWLFAGCGCVLILNYIYHSMDVSFNLGSLYMLIAVVLCGIGYAEGGKLSKTLGGWQVICWALIMALPLMLILSYVYFPKNLPEIRLPAYLALGYVSLFSMLIGFFFWYRGLALGGIAAVGQLQLLQPLIGFGLAAWLLHESISIQMIFTAIAIMFTVICAKRFA